MFFSDNKSAFCSSHTLCRQTLSCFETPKRVLWQTVKTKMKCRITRHFIKGLHCLLRLKRRQRTKVNFSWKLYHVTPQYMCIYNEPSQAYCIISDRKTHQNKSKKEDKDQEAIQSSTTPDPGYKWESYNVKKKTSQTRVKRSTLSQQVTTRHQQTDVHEIITKTRQK